MPGKKVVLDTNCLISSISRRGKTYPAWKGFQEGRYILCVTNEILEEYEEVIAQKICKQRSRNLALNYSHTWQAMIFGADARG